MRSAEQLSRTPREYLDYKQAERQRVLDALLRLLAAVRHERPEWYVWVTEGQPPMSDAEYERISKARRSRRREP